jgi:hypothetical protein
MYWFGTCQRWGEDLSMWIEFGFLKYCLKQGMNGQIRMNACDIQCTPPVPREVVAVKIIKHREVMKAHEHK